MDINNRKNDGHPFFLKWAPWFILLLTAIIYFKAAFFQLTVFDDTTFITKNPLITDASLDGIKKIFTSFASGKYNPLTNFSFAIEHYFFDFNPIPYHVDNIILHLLSTLLVFKISERLSGSRITGAIVSILFALHPMHVEEVAWASERKDTLYAVFFLWAFWMYLRFLDGRRWTYYWISFFLFIASVLAKSEAITLPLVLFATDLFTGRRPDRKLIIEKLPFLLCSIAIAVTSAASQHGDGGLGAVSAASYGFLNRIFLAISVPAFYIIKLFLPFHLSAMHYYPDMHRGMLPWQYYASAPFLAAVTFALIRLPALSRPNETFLKKQIIFGISFFVLTICVMPQLIFVGPAFTPERYSYIPYIGFFFIMGQWISKVGLPARRTVTIVALSAYLLMCFAITWVRLDVWKDSETLMTDMIEKNSHIEDCSFLYWLRGNARVDEKDMTGAIEDYTTAIKQHRRYVAAYVNRGAAHFQAGDLVAGIHDLDSSILFDPGHARSYYNRASSKASIGDLKGALADYNRFLTLQPNDNQAYMDRGMVRITMKDTAGACDDWKRAASLGNKMALQYARQVCK